MYLDLQTKMIENYIVALTLINETINVIGFYFIKQFVIKLYTIHVPPTILFNMNFNYNKPIYSKLFYSSVFYFLITNTDNFPATA